MTHPGEQGSAEESGQRLQESEGRRIHRFQVDGGKLKRDALSRGVMATLYLLPYTGDQRVFAIINHLLDRTAFEIIPAVICEVLWGTSAPGVYDVPKVERLDHDPGAMG